MHAFTFQHCDWYPSLTDINHALLRFGAPVELFPDLEELIAQYKSTVDVKPLQGKETGQPRKKKRKLGDAFGPSTTSDISNTKAAPAPCFYCDKKTTNTHPYVPFNSAGPLPFCVACEKTWNQFREDTKQKNKLHLNGDFNEEICALCSNWPKQLYCCSNCPRSYCKSCLKRILSRSELKAVDEPGDWNCAYCTHQQKTRSASPAASDATARKKSGVMQIKKKALTTIPDECEMDPQFTECGNRGAGPLINWLQCISALYGRPRGGGTDNSGAAASA